MDTKPIAPPASADDLLKQLRDALPTPDVEADIAARDAAREAAEQTDMGAIRPDAGLPLLMPVDNGVMRSLGKEGPHWVKFVIEAPLLDADGKPVYRTDDEGFEEPVFTQRKLKRKIAPYTIGRQVEATLAISSCNPLTQKAALCWSLVGGEPGALTPAKCAELLEKMIPKRAKNDLTGETEERAPFTPEMVEGLLAETTGILNDDNTEALVTAVAMAFEEFSPDVDEVWLIDTARCSQGELTRILGKILAINNPLRDRFLA